MDRYLKYIKRKWANVSFGKNVDIRLNEPVISFTFDDAPASAFDNGGGILSKYGFSGTFYIAVSLMQNADTLFTVPQLEEAIYNHHELGCHTFNHIDLSKTNLKHSIFDIEHNQEAINAIMPDIKFRNFSYPFGAQTRGIKQYLSGQFRSARGIEHGINAGRTDLCNLRAVKLYENKHSLDQIFENIQKAIDHNAWLIFYTHDVSNDPSKHGCSPGYFEAVVKECVAGGFRVATIDEAMDLVERN